MAINAAILFLIVLPLNSYGYSFTEAVAKVKDHEKLKAAIFKSKSIIEEGNVLSSWGDPVFQVTARNYPVETLNSTASPMTGIVFGASQNLPLTSRYRVINKAYDLMSKSQILEAEHMERSLLQLLWNFAITKEQIFNDVKILNENLVWIKSMLITSKRLYANGKVSQQAILELEIRKAEILSELSNKNHDLKIIDKKLTYLFFAQEGSLDLKTVPWTFLSKDKESGDETGLDLKEKALNINVLANEAKVKVEKLSFVPDVTLSANYIKRNEFDDIGDFFSVGISFPLPLSSKEYAAFDKSLMERNKAIADARDYALKRRSQLSASILQIKKISEELLILEKELVVFAQSSRDIISKSYGLGRTSYIELTQAELRLQNILLRKNALKSELASRKVEKLFLSGEALYEI